MPTRLKRRKYQLQENHKRETLFKFHFGFTGNGVFVCECITGPHCRGQLSKLEDPFSIVDASFDMARDMRDMYRFGFMAISKI